MKKAHLFTLALCIGALAAAPTNAQPVELKLGTWGPPSSFFIKEVIEPWIENVNRDSQGTLVIRHFGASVLGDQRRMYDSVRSNVAHIGWITPSNTPGKFKRTAVFELPFGVRNGEEGSVVAWRLYDQGLMNDEYDEVVVLGAMLFPAGGVMTRTRKVTTLDDLAGLKLRVTGALQNETLKALGATTVALSIDKVYQSLDKGVIDGYAAAFTAIMPFRLHEVTKYYTQVPLNATMGALAINKQTFDSLPAQAKAAIAKHSGEAMSRDLGKSADRQVARALDLIKQHEAQGKAELDQLSAAEEKRWQDRTEPLIQDWAQATPDGSKVLATFRKETAAVAHK